MADPKITNSSQPTTTPVVAPEAPASEVPPPSAPPAPATEAAPGMASPTPDKVLAEKMGTPTAAVGGPYGQQRARPTASSVYYAKDKAEKDLRTAFASALSIHRLDSTTDLGIKGTAAFDPSTGRLMYIQVDNADVSADVVQSFRGSARRVVLPTSSDMEIKYNETRGEGGATVRTIEPIIVPFHFTTV